MLRKGNLFVRNLRYITRMFRDEAITIGSEQDTKSPEYQVRTRVHACFVPKRAILKIILKEFYF